jgi:hypothetical protein
VDSPDHYFARNRHDTLFFDREEEAMMLKKGEQ